MNVDLYPDLLPETRAAAIEALRFANDRGYSPEKFATAEQVEAWRVRGKAGQQKYLLLEKGIIRAARIIQTIGLNRVGQKLRILDIGSGPCYFGLMARMLGHDVVALDVEDPLYNNICRFFEIPLVLHRIYPQKPLPSDLTGFDLVTAISIKFHNPRGFFWTQQDWSYLIDYVRRQVMTPEGSIYLSFNHRPEHVAAATEAVDAVAHPYLAIDHWLRDAGFSSPTEGIYASGPMAHGVSLTPVAAG